MGRDFILQDEMLQAIILRELRTKMKITLYKMKYVLYKERISFGYTFSQQKETAMSLEDKVDALTTAIAGLTLAINAQTTLVAPQATTPAKEASKPAPAKGKPAAKKEEPKAEATNEAEIVITFEDLKKAVVAAADKDKPATAAALKALGVAKISELKEPQYKAALEALTAVVEGEPETPQETSFV